MAREWTEEQKQAARERLAAARAKKQEIIAAKQKQASGMVEEPIIGMTEEPIAGMVEKQSPNTTDPSVAELTKMVLELKKQLEEKQASNPQTDLISALQALNGGNQSQFGKPTGVKDRYSTELSLYPDPRQDLRNEARLKRIAFDVNYELDWIVNTTRYQTADGTWMREPKFNIKLNQVVLDDDGEPTNRRIGKAQLIFFEDPETAVIVAQQNGLAIDEDNSAEFLNAMRYLRTRDWLFECFWPPRANTNNRQQMVVGGQIVDTWEVSTEGNASIPFGELKSKLR